MINLLLIIFASVLAFVISETNTGVTESFAQIFEILHEDVNDIHLKTHGSINEITKRLSSTVHNTKFALTRQQNEAKAAVNEQMQEALEQLNLLLNSDKVNKCVNHSNDAIEKLIIRSDGGFEVCKTLDAEKVDDVNVILSGIYIKEEKVHRDLEASKMLCNSVVKNTAQLINCLYYQLFVVQQVSVNELKGESKQAVQEYNSTFKNAENTLKACSKVVAKNILDETDQIALRFRNCMN